MIQTLNMIVMLRKALIQEFFEKRKYISKVRRAQPYSSPTRKGVSLDLQFIQTVERTHGPQNRVSSTVVRKPVVVDLEGHASIPRPPRRQENLELPNMSPVKTVSVLQLASATERLNANGSQCAHREIDNKLYRAWEPGDNYHMKESKLKHSGSLISSHGPVVYRTPHSTESLGTKMNRNGHIFDSAPKSCQQLHSLSDVELETPYLYLNNGSQVGLCTIQEEGAQSKSVHPKSSGMGSSEEDRNNAKLGKRALYTVSEDFQMTPLKRYHEPTKKHKDHHQGCHEAVFGTERALFDQWDGSRRSSHLNWQKTSVRDDEDDNRCAEDNKKKLRSGNVKGAGNGHEWDRLRIHENLNKKHSNQTKKMESEHLGDGEHPFGFRSDYQRDNRRKHNVIERDERQDLYQNDEVKPGTCDKRAKREKRHRFDEYYEKRRSNSGDMKTCSQDFDQGVKRIKDDRKPRTRTDSFLPKQKMQKLLTSTPVPDSRIDLTPLEELMDDTAFNKKHPRPLHDNVIEDKDEGLNQDLGMKRGVCPPVVNNSVLERESYVEDTLAMPIYKERLFSLLGMSQPTTEQSASPWLHGQRIDNVQHPVERRTKPKSHGSTDLNKQVRTSIEQSKLGRNREVCRLENCSDKATHCSNDKGKIASDNDLKSENSCEAFAGDETNLVSKEVSTEEKLAKPLIDPRDQCTSKEPDRPFGSNSSIKVVSEDQGQVVRHSVLVYNAAKKLESVEIECSWNSSNGSQGNRTKKYRKGQQSSAQDALDELLQLDDMCNDAEMDEELNLEEQLERETKCAKEFQEPETAIDERVLTFMTSVQATGKDASESLRHDENFVKTIDKYIPVELGKDAVFQNDVKDVVPNSQISSQLTFEAMQLEYYSNLMKITPVKRKCVPPGSDRSASTGEKVKQEPTGESALQQKFDQLNVFQDTFNKDATPRSDCDKIESFSSVLKSPQPVLMTPPESIVKETVPEAVPVTVLSPVCDVSTSVCSLSDPIHEKCPFDKSRILNVYKIPECTSSPPSIKDKQVTREDEIKADIQLKHLMMHAKVEYIEQTQKGANESKLESPCRLPKLETTASPLKRFSDIGITCDILSDIDKVSPMMKDVGVSCNLLVAPEFEKRTNTEPCVSGRSIQTDALILFDRSANTEAVVLASSSTQVSPLESNGPANLALKDDGTYIITALKPCMNNASESPGPPLPLASQAEVLSSSIPFENIPVSDWSTQNVTKLPFEDILVSDLSTRNVTKLPFDDILCSDLSAQNVTKLPSQVDACNTSEIEDGMLSKKNIEFYSDFETQFVELEDSTDPPVADIMDTKLENMSGETTVVQGCLGIPTEETNKDNPLDDSEVGDGLLRAWDTLVDPPGSSSFKDFRVDVTTTSNQEKDNCYRVDSDECSMETGEEKKGGLDMTTKESKEDNALDDSVAGDGLCQVRDTTADPSSSEDLMLDVATASDQEKDSYNSENLEECLIEKGETAIATCTCQELSVVTPSMSSNIGQKCPADEAVELSSQTERVIDVVVDLKRFHDEQFSHCPEKDMVAENPQKVGCAENHCQHPVVSMKDQTMVVNEEFEDRSMLSTESDHEGDINSTPVFEVPESSDFQETVITETPVFGGDASPVFGRLDMTALRPVSREEEELLLSPVFRKDDGELCFSPVYTKKEAFFSPAKEESFSPCSREGSKETSSVVLETEKENEDTTSSSDDSAVTGRTQTNDKRNRDNQREPSHDSLVSGLIHLRNIPKTEVQECYGCDDFSGESKSNVAEAMVMVDSKTEVSPGALFQQPFDIKSAIGILDQNISHCLEYADENGHRDEELEEVERDSALSMAECENSVAGKSASTYRAERHSRIKKNNCSALADKRNVEVLYARSSSDEVTTPRSKLRLKRFSIVAEGGQKMGKKSSVSPRGAKVVKKSSEQKTKRLGRSFRLYSGGAIFGEDLPEVSDAPKAAEPGMTCGWSLRQNDELKEIRKEIDKIRAKNNDSIWQTERRDRFAGVTLNDTSFEVKVRRDDIQNDRCFTPCGEERRCSDEDRNCIVGEDGTRDKVRSCSVGGDGPNKDNVSSCRVGADVSRDENSCSLSRNEDKSCSVDKDENRPDGRISCVGEDRTIEEGRACKIGEDVIKHTRGKEIRRSIDGDDTSCSVDEEESWVEDRGCDIDVKMDEGDVTTTYGPTAARIGCDYDESIETKQKNHKSPWTEDDESSVGSVDDGDKTETGWEQSGFEGEFEEWGIIGVGTHNTDSSEGMPRYRLRSQLPQPSNTCSMH
ncbi:uncharacterized protein LOC135490948 [Lineus longissimus]|uniref:uncharacterized protein LOC135490948 n=1 Tax=Lineus longissimus TaxID=88925 RepID=UPI00315CC04E